MAGRLILVLAVPVVAAALVLALAGMLRRWGRAGHAGAVRVRTTLGGLASAVAAVLALSFLLMGEITPGALVASVAPAVVATVMVIASTLVELTWPKPTGTLRVARVARRPAAPRALGRVLAGSAALTALLLLVAGLVASTDGRSITVQWATGSVSTGPWPGWYYGAPMAVATAVLLAATGWALRVIDRRPAQPSEVTDADRAARVLSKARVLRAACLGSVGTLTPLALVMGGDLNRLAGNLRMNQSPLAHYPPWDWRQDLGFGLIGLCLGGLVLLARITWPRRLDDTDAVAPAGRTAGPRHPSVPGRP